MKRLTDTQKSAIRELRACGLGYGTIAKRLSLSRYTVRSFCVRNNVQAGTETVVKADAQQTTDASVIADASEKGHMSISDAGNSSKVKIGDTVFVITTGYSKNASETLEQKLAKLIINEAAKQIA